MSTDGGRNHKVAKAYVLAQGSKTMGELEEEMLQVPCAVRACLPVSNKQVPVSNASTPARPYTCKCILNFYNKTFI